MKYTKEILSRSGNKTSFDFEDENKIMIDYENPSSVG